MPSPRPLLLVTGFGPFLRVARNPSGEVAAALAAAPPEGVEVAVRVLSVSFADAPRELEGAIEELAPRRPDAILALGMQKESWFRLERRARCRLDAKKPDCDGVYARELGAVGERDFTCELDFERLLSAVLAAGAVRAGISGDAGGYVCERIYHAALSIGERLAIPALFLHVPAARHVSIKEQLPVVRALAAELVRQIGGGARPAT